YAVYLSRSLPQEEAPAKKLRLTKPSKSAALHIDLCKAPNPTDALYDYFPLSLPGVSGGVCVRDAQSVISDYFSNQDPRVRTAAIKAMQVRLVDDSFGKISHVVSDGSWVVRVQAAKTLSNMLQVSPQFLEQTLDKKLMSDLRRKCTAHERAKELYASGEFSSGRKWADDAPKEKVDTSAVNLIASGALFVFGGCLCVLVRIAAVDAFSALAQSSASFAEMCLDFLVDMFNDEIEAVRLQSIHILRQISINTLREDQLDTVLAVLEDSSRDIREALHELLCFTNVSTKECIQLALLELLKNLTKYPTDRNSVWKCLKFLGCRHPTLVLPLVPELLSTHPYFHTPEPDMDGPAYIAVLVLVFNAAQSCPTMTALFSDHTFRHYTYLRDSLSHLVPPLRLPGRKQAPGGSGIEGSRSVESAQLFLQQSLSRVSTIQNLQDPGAQDLLNFTISVKSPAALPFLTHTNR
uniref:Integrator complex subunit 4 n=1 Tax=Oncorhynchus tshawytscha TaxID=74940 RepID=A0A8C8GS82_ONCTS